MVIAYLKKYHIEDRLLKISVKKKIWNIWRLAMGKDYWLIRCCYPMIFEKKTLFCIFRNNLRYPQRLPRYYHGLSWAIKTWWVSE